MNGKAWLYAIGLALVVVFVGEIILDKAGGTWSAGSYLIGWIACMAFDFGKEIANRN